MYKIYCFTTYDEWKRLSWPEQLDARPMVGEFIRDKAGTVNAKIARITHFIHTGKSYIELYLVTEDGKVPQYRLS